MNANIVERPNKLKVAILGAGFAGVRTALDLAKSTLDLEITLVNRDTYHEFHPDLYEAATAALAEPKGMQIPRLTYENLRGSVAIPLEEIFKKTRIKIIIDTVVSLNLRTQKIYLNKSGLLTYDFLVLALGSETNYFGIPNLKNSSLPLKGVNDALNIRNRIDELIARKSSTGKINIVVGGGGFTGCELAGELVGYLRTLGKIHTNKQHNVEITVVEANPVLIKGTSESVQQAVKERLWSLGINIYLNSKITSVSESNIFTDPHQEIPYDLLIWTAGIRSNGLVDKLTGVHTEKTCLIIDKSLRVISFKNVFAIGDIAFCYDEEKSYQAPATAQIAIEQGKYVAKNIIHLIKNEPLLLYSPKKPKFVVPLGGKFAVAEFLGVLLIGIEAWWLKRVAAFLYFRSILPTLKAFSLWTMGNKFFIENDPKNGR